jgi:hypothetical protein
MTMTQGAKGAAIAEAHYQWTMRHSKNMPFDPSQQTGEPDDDYNQHHLTVSGSPEQQKELTDAINAILEIP